VQNLNALSGINESVALMRSSTQHPARTARNGISHLFSIVFD